MGTVKVPNLVYYDALKFCRDFEVYEWEDVNLFDFKLVNTCEPFAMLCVGQKIIELRKKHADAECKGQNVDNDYAENMRFYRYIGMKKGRPLDLDCGNGNFQPISDLNLLKILQESRQTNRPFGELVTDTSKTLAMVLARNNKNVMSTMTFCLREIIRNIKEHSNSLNGWYCAQYWPTKDLVELAIIDDGRGILESINSNYRYACEGLTNEQAIIKAMQSGISRTFDDNYSEEIFAGTGTEWKNSGYGLYIVSRICAKTGGNFTLASGDTSVKVENDSVGNIKYTSYPTSINGTAIRIRLKVSGLAGIDDIIKVIHEEGKNNGDEGFSTPSKASSFYFI